MSDYYVWVYILESRDRRYWTVGAARNLVECFEQYAPEPSETFPDRLVAVYRFSMPREQNDGLGARHPDCIRYEKKIAAQWMRRVGSEWHNVVSILGTFQKGDREPAETRGVAFPVVCFCGYPAELRTAQAGHKYYCCCRRNRGWILEKPLPDFIAVEAHKSCGFYAWSQLYAPR